MNTRGSGLEMVEGTKSKGKKGLAISVIKVNGGENFNKDLIMFDGGGEITLRVGVWGP